MRLGFMVILAAFAGAALLGSGCGDEEATGTTAGGGGSGTGGAGGEGTNATSTAVTTGASTGTGPNTDGNDSFATAEDISIPFDEAAELFPVGDEDYYKFEGLAGQALYIDIAAESRLNVAYDVDTIDTVITLYDASERQIAQNDQATPNFSNDAQLFTILPVDGDYYLRVTECHTWGGKTCPDPADKSGTGYTLVIFELDPAVDSIVADTEPNDDVMTANPVTYSKTMDGGYFYTNAYGTFAPPADTDVYVFNVPTDLMNLMGRTTATFYAMPSGVDGNGSTVAIGKFAIVDPANPTMSLAEVDASTGSRLQPPLTFGQDYHLFVQRENPAAPMSGPHDFYFWRHTFGGSNPLETQELANDVASTAEPLTGEVNGSNFSYFVEGDIVAAPADIDHFSVDATVVAAGGNVNIACGSWRRGSGLRSFKASILLADGTPVAGATETESDTQSLSFDTPIPNGAQTLIVKMEAASQAPTVTSSFYRCGIHFSDP